MIALDFGILTMLTASVEEMPETKEEFMIQPSKATRHFLARHQSIFRLMNGTGHVFVTDLLATFSGGEIELNKNTILSFPIYLNNISVSKYINASFRLDQLPKLQELASSFKTIYVVLFDGNSSGDHLLNNNFLMALAPPTLSLEKSKVSGVIQKQTNKIFKSFSEDDDYIQFNFKNAREGIYEIELINEPNQEIYVNTNLYIRPPLCVAVLELEPSTKFPTKELNIQFQKKA